MLEDVFSYPDSNVGLVVNHGIIGQEQAIENLSKRVDRYLQDPSSPLNRSILGDADTYLLIQRVWRLLSNKQGYSDFQIARLLGAVSKILEESNGEKGVELVMTTSENMNAFAQKQIMKIATQISKADLEDILELAPRLFTETMPDEEKVNILRALSEVPFEDREDVVQQTLRLISDNTKDLDRRKLLNAAISIPFEDREEVVDHGLPLISGRASVAEKIMILNRIARMKRDDRPEMMAQAWGHLFSSNPDLEAKFSEIGTRNIPIASILRQLSRPLQAINPLF